MTDDTTTQVHRTRAASQASHALTAWLLAGILGETPTPALLHAKHSATRRELDITILTEIAGKVRALLATMLTGLSPEAVLGEVLHWHTLSNRPCAVALALAVLPDVLPMPEGSALYRAWATAMQASLASTPGFFAAATVWLRMKDTAMPTGTAIRWLRRRCEQAPDSTLTIELKSDIGFAGLTLRHLLRTYLYQSTKERLQTPTCSSSWIHETVRDLHAPISRLARASENEQRNCLLRLAVAHPTVIPLLVGEQLPTGPWTRDTADAMRTHGLYERLIAKAPMALRMQIASFLGGYDDLRAPILRALQTTTPAPMAPMHPMAAELLREELQTLHGEEPKRATWCADIVALFDTWCLSPGALRRTPTTAVRRLAAMTPTANNGRRDHGMIIIATGTAPRTPASANERRHTPNVVLGGRRASDTIGNLQTEAARAKVGACEVQQLLDWAALAPAA